jgi:hypothetical protein
MKELTEEENLKTEETWELTASLDKTHQELTEYQTNMVSINKYAYEFLRLSLFSLRQYMFAGLMHTCLC